MATKRRKVDGSQIFAPFRALGFVSNHVPLVLQTRGTEHFVATAIGKSFHLYNCAKLNLLFVGTTQSEPIRCMESYKEMLITASGNKVTTWQRNKPVNVFEGHKKDVHLLLTFGQHVISVDEENAVKIWNVETAEVYLEMQFEESTFKLTALLHPSTYLNKILLCSHQGPMQLWNIRTNRLIYTFKGWDEPITAIAQAPAVDVAAIGLQSGKIIVHNLKYDETLMTFTQDWGPVTSISLRTDRTPIMATGSPAGHIALWDLEKRQLCASIRHAHDGAVTGMKYLQSQPLLITSGPDNALKIWIFDQPDNSARLLRSRSGHCAPPVRIRFHGNKGHNLISAGLDRSLRIICTIKDARSGEMSQGSLLKKSKSTGVKMEELRLPTVTNFASEELRESHWDNVVTCHHGHGEVRTWSFQKKCMGQHTLKSTSQDAKSTAQCVTVSSCGNFAVVGYSCGQVSVFNMQSGLHRGSLSKAHNGVVRGVALDSLNQMIITGSSDTTVKFWHFKKKSLIHSMKFAAPIAQMVIHRPSSLLAVSCDDFTVHIVDIDTKRVVREFSGHRNRVTDMAFSPDGRWLVTSSMDSTIRTWNLPVGRLIDCFMLESPATSITMSPVGDFLAVSFVDDLGVYLWSNKTLYSDVSLVPLPADFQPNLVDLPSTQAEKSGEGEDDEDEEEDNMEDEEELDEEKTEEFKSPDQIGKELISLSLLPQSRWRNLTNLALIKQRNKPKEPPKAPKAAPFFLPTMPGLVPKFIPTEDDLEDTQEPLSKVFGLGDLQAESDFQKSLKKCHGLQQYTDLMEEMKAMGPSAIDVELRTLAPDAGGSVDMMVMALEFFEWQLSTRRDFELAQAYMALFFKLHGDTIASDPRLIECVERLQTQHEKSWSHLQDLLNESMCLVTYLKSAVI